MKSLTELSLTIVFVALILQIVTAQQPDDSPILIDSTATANASINKRLQADLDSRYSYAENPVAKWFKSGDGYYGPYSVAGEEYMITYDKYGNYIATLNKGHWNEIPLLIQASLDQGAYKNRDVIEFWEFSDPTGRKCYYLEFEEVNGKKSSAWADKNGKLSAKPPRRVFPRRSY